MLARFIYGCACIGRRACMHVYMYICAYVVLKPVTSWVLFHCFMNEAIVDELSSNRYYR